MAEPTTLLDDLYRDILLDHYRSPRNQGDLAAPTCSADGSNPLCGDQVRVEATVRDGRIVEISFTGHGCSVSQASASMMTEYVKGRSLDEAHASVEAFRDMMITAEPSDREGFGDIAALVGVARFPARVKCASLAWKTLEQALDGDVEPVTTDERSTSHA